MANKTYQLFPLSDDSLLASLGEIAEELGVTGSATTAIHLASGPPVFGPRPFSELLEDETIQSIRDSNAIILERFSFTFVMATHTTSISFSRPDGQPQVVLTVPDQQSPADSGRIHLAVGKALAKHDRLTLIDRRLGKELREFEERREAGLHRLEEISRATIRRSEEHIQTLELRHEEARSRVQEQHEKSEAELQKQYDASREKLTDQERLIEEREAALDDRDNTHARREPHKDLKKSLAERNSEFGLTDQTNRKRWPIHILFAALILAATSATVFYASQQLAVEAAAGSFDFRLLRLSLSAIALLGTIAWYIRWQDKWAQAHADVPPLNPAR